MFSIRFKLIGVAILFLFSALVLQSCSLNGSLFKKHYAGAAISQKGSIRNDNLNESDADLFTVDYSQFYDELAPHGKWIEVNANEIGLKGYKGTASGEIEDKSEFLSSLSGVRNVRAAENDVDFGVFFVWMPDPSLAVTVAAGEPVVYEPYVDGQWIYTDDGWYFQAPTPYEEITVHYGRWVFAPVCGWVWVPGRVWSPAWVEWRDDDDYIAWAPIPPRVYIEDGVFAPPYYDDDSRFFCVEQRHFCDPEVYRYRVFNRENGDPLVIHNLRPVDGITVRNNVVIDPGPNVHSVEKHLGRNIDPVNVVRVNDRTQAGINGKEMKVYNPQFNRVQKPQNPNTLPVSHPKSFENYKNVVTDVRGSNSKGPGNITSNGMNRNNLEPNNFTNKNYGKNNPGNNNVTRNNGRNNTNNNKYQPSGRNNNGKYTYKGNNNRTYNSSGNNKTYRQKGNNSYNPSRYGNSGNNKRNNGSYKNSGKNNSYNPGKNTGNYGNRSRGNNNSSHSNGNNVNRSNGNYGKGNNNTHPNNNSSSGKNNGNNTKKGR